MVHTKGGFPPVGIFGASLAFLIHGLVVSLAAQDVSAVVTIINQTQGQARLNWVNFNGNEQFFGSISGGQTVQQRTFLGHQWVVRDAQNQVLQRVTVSQAAQTVTLSPSQPAPPIQPAQQQGTMPQFQPANFSLTNQTGGIIRLNYFQNGQEINMGTLRAGQLTNVGSFVGTQWVIKDGQGNKLTSFTVSQGMPQVVVGQSNAGPAMQGGRGLPGTQGGSGLPRSGSSGAGGMGGGTTYWLGRKSGGNLVYDLQLPQFFVNWMKTPTPIGGGARNTRQINGQSYTFYSQSFSWDDGGSNPDASGQIALRSEGLNLMWQIDPSFTNPQHAILREALRDMASPLHGGSPNWKIANDVSMVEVNGRAAPGLSLSQSGLPGGGGAGPGTGGGVGGPGPLSVTSEQRVPAIVAVANANDSIDVAWTRSDGQLLLSTYSFVGEAYQRTAQNVVQGFLGQLGGFTRDQAGNGYVLTAVKENITQGSGKLQRPDIVHLLKIPAGTSNANFLADLNQSLFTSFWEVYNPFGQRTSRLVYGNGILAATFGHNNWGGDLRFHDTGTLIGITTEGAAAYNGGAGHHFMGFRMMFDQRSNRFVRTQEGDQGIMMSTLYEGPSGQWVWSRDKHIVVTPNAGEPWHDDLIHFTRMGQIASSQTHYLLNLSYDDGGWAVTGDVEWSGDVSGAQLQLVRVPKQGFESAPDLNTSSWVSVPAVERRTLKSPSVSNFNIVRPRMVEIPGSGYVIIYEEWSAQKSYKSTHALLIDEFGNQLGSRNLPDVRIQRVSDAFYLPIQQRVGWVVGDPGNGRIVLFTLDRNLNLQNHTLSIQ